MIRTLKAKGLDRRLLLGPVLHFRGIQRTWGQPEDGPLDDGRTGRWRVSALFVIEGEDEPPDLSVDGVLLPVPPRHVDVLGDAATGPPGPPGRRSRHVWRFEFAIPRGDADSRVGYGFPGRDRWYLTVPGRGGRPRLAYVNAGGLADETALKEQGLPRNGRWGHLIGVHRSQPFHLLLHGGDQIDTGSIERAAPSLTAWAALPTRERLEAPFTAAMRAELDAFYADLYLTGWKQAEVAALLASLPSIMVWDDRDILPGWGSQPDEQRLSPVMQGLFATARRHYTIFQLGLAPEETEDLVWGFAAGSFIHGWRIGDLGLLALDLRSERSRTQILGERSATELAGWLDRFAGCRHLLVLCAVPLAFPRPGGLGRLVAGLPDADPRDSWRSADHEMEWLSLLHLLGSTAQRRRLRVTILSGKLHLSAAARLRGGGAELRQLVSAGIVHPPPPGFRTEILERLTGGTETVRDGLTLAALPFPGTGRRLLRARSWICLTLDEAGTLIAEFHPEGDKPVMQRVPPADVT